MTRWISVDLATTAGIAVWFGETLIDAYLLSTNKRQDKWTLESFYRPSPTRGFVAPSEFMIWRQLIMQPMNIEGPIAARLPMPTRGLVIERGHGRNPVAIDSLARRRGYVTGLAHAWGCDNVFEVHQGTWRARAAKHFGEKSWPKASEAAKAKAVALVRQSWDVDVPPDTAEAIMLGVGAKALRIMPAA